MDITTSTFGALVPGVFGFFFLCCAYAAQYWAYRCYKELKKINDRAEAKQAL